MTSLGLWIIATGIVAVSLESCGVALGALRDRMASGLTREQFWVPSSAGPIWASFPSRRLRKHRGFNARCCWPQGCGVPRWACKLKASSDTDQS